MGWQTLEQQREYNKQYRIDNASRIKETQKRFRERNKEKIAQKNKEW